jgi:AcrB/AcrD/AcrF family
MTTIAMVAGMFPSALARGDGGEFRAPMAIAVIGGLIVSTVLSLVFVPAVFAFLDDIGRLVWRLVGGLVGETDEPEIQEPVAFPPRVVPASREDLKIAAE